MTFSECDPAFAACESQSTRGKNPVCLMGFIVAHPVLQGLRRWILVTADAHDLYRKYGFTLLARPESFMELHDPGIYALNEA